MDTEVVFRFDTEETITLTFSHTWNFDEHVHRLLKEHKLTGVTFKIATAGREQIEAQL